MVSHNTLSVSIAQRGIVVFVCISSELRLLDSHCAGDTLHQFYRFLDCSCTATCEWKAGECQCQSVRQVHICVVCYSVALIPAQVHRSRVILQADDDDDFGARSDYDGLLCVKESV